MKLNPVPNAKEVLDNAFKRASKLMLPKIRVNKKRELKEFLETKIKTAASALDDRLTGIIKQFPDLDNSPSFLQEMIGIAIEPGEYKRALGHLQSKKKLLKMILRKSTGAIHKSKNERESSRAEKAFFGRVSSIINELNSDLLLLENARWEMKEFPDIDNTTPTAIIAGFPNVGKTTILKRLTGSAPEIAAYPFTTKGLQLGYFEEKYLRFQIIDTPGLLDRPTSERNPVEKKAINALKNLAGILVFVVDATGSSGYTISEQKHLLEEIQRDFKKQTIIVINKSDISSAEQIEQAKKEFGSDILVCGENQNDELRKKIVAELKKTITLD